MSNMVHLCLVLHNHQPIGNFGEVLQQAYFDSYLPFLEVFEEYPGLHLSLHTSGPLMLWLAQEHPDYVQRLSTLVAAGNVEIIGGAMYEPILTMLPSRDRIGQIQKYSNYLNELLQTEIRGLWIPERVWESVLTSDLVRAGIQYTVLDDYHFVAAGCPKESLTGYYLTEDDGHLLRVFPGSERLRYLIPFADVERTIDFARQTSQSHPEAILVFADDGEKFGTWPETRAHVYDRGWLRNFFDALVANSDWIKTSTLAEAVQSHSPAGKVYLPECSYREMTHWALPASGQVELSQVINKLQSDADWPGLESWLRGGNWRNFRVKYSEADEMYSRMLQVSRKLCQAGYRSGDSYLLSEAEDHLFRGQCNCAYWHGAFGGIYLPHLRNAVFSELIAADNQLDTLEHGKGPWVDATSDDYNLDTCNEVRLANDQLVVYIAPSTGGMIYELDVRAAQHNLMATMQRRPEVYHARIAEFAARNHSHIESQDVASIHDRMTCKQAGLEDRLQYDKHPRKGFIEHFFDNDLTASKLAQGMATERGDFVTAPFEAKLRRAVNKVQLQLTRQGNAWGIPLRLTKALTLQAGSSTLDIAYLIEGLPQDRPLHLALEWNFAGLPADANDRFFYSEHGASLGNLGTALDLSNIHHIGLVDEWRKLNVALQFNRPTQLWTLPVATVSQSEGGFELVHQSVCMMPHWLIQGDSDGTWMLQMSVAMTTGSKAPVFVPHSTEVACGLSTNAIGQV